MRGGEAAVSHSDAVGRLDPDGACLGVLPLRHVVEDLDDLAGVDGLLLHQNRGDAVEGVAVGRQDLTGLFVGLGDQLADLLIDRRGDLVGEILALV